VPLWKKILAWVKQTQRPRFAVLFALIKRDFHRSRETEIEFPICAKTSILSGFLMCRKNRAGARCCHARQRFAQCRSAARAEQSKVHSGVAYTVR
jgi:hypothetical protein